MCIFICIYIYSGILFSHKKNEILPLANNMDDLVSIMLSETSQEKDKIPNPFIHLWNLRNKKIKKGRKKRDKPKNSPTKTKTQQKNKNPVS